MFKKGNGTDGQFFFFWPVKVVFPAIFNVYWINKAHLVISPRSNIKLHAPRLNLEF